MCQSSPLFSMEDYSKLTWNIFENYYTSSLPLSPTGKLVKSRICSRLSVIGHEAKRDLVL